MSSFRAAGLLFAVLGTVSATEPTLEHLYSAAGQQGTTVSVAATGKFDPWPPRVWVDAPGIVFKPAKDKGKFDVAIAPDAAPGPHLVRLFNEDGASIPRFFIVSTEPELPEIEPNDDFKSPQKIASLPATISGRLDKSGDVDSFGVTLKKGQTLSAWVEAYVLASTFDGMLRIVDPDGVELAFNHDGRTLDPDLTWEAPRDGFFIVQLMGFAYPATSDVRLTGGEGCVYRLHLATTPRPGIPFPPHDASQGPEIATQEPDPTAANAQPIPVPCCVSGCIDQPGQEDRFAFTAVKKKTYEFQVISARTGTPLDAWVAVENKDGKQLKHKDDTEDSREPQLTWTAPGDGAYRAVVGDLTHHGGAEYVYRLYVTEAQPSVTGTATSHSLVVAAGQTGEIKATVKRANGFKAKLQLAAKNLPEGVTAPEVEVPEKDGEVALKFNAEPETPATSQPIQLLLRETESGREHPIPYSMIITEKDNGVPKGYKELVINSTDQLWLTVTTADLPQKGAKDAK